MNDLKQRVKTIERLEPPDLWPRIVSGERPGLSSTHRARSKMVAAVVSLLLFGAAASGLWYAFSRPLPEVPMGPSLGGPEAVVRVRSTAGTRTATLTYGGAEAQAQVSECPVRVIGCTLFVPDPSRFLPMPRGTVLHLEGWPFHGMSWCEEASSTVSEAKQYASCSIFKRRKLSHGTSVDLSFPAGTYVVELHGRAHASALTVAFGVAIVSRHPPFTPTASQSAAAQ